MESQLLLEDKLVLLQKEKGELYVGDGSVDFHGKPSLKNKTGNWRASFFVLVDECCERLAYYSIARNLVSYLTNRLHQGNVSAARDVATWTGTSYLAPFIGAFLADAYWGRYWTIAVFFAVYFIGMCSLTLCASVPALKPAECVGSVCPSATPTQRAVFFSGLYLVSLGVGVKSCLSSFGADQFDHTDPKERMKKGSFFNWYFLSMSIGTLVSSSLIIFVQENLGWGLGFGIPTLFSGVAIANFICGTPYYRLQRPGGSPLTRILQVLVASWHKRKLEVPEDSSLLYETPGRNSAIEGSRKLEHTEELKCLDKAAVLSDEERQIGDFSNRWRLCTVTQVEELKILIRMFPVWAAGVVYFAGYSQMSTTFVEQGTAMYRRVGSFTIPAASLSTFSVITSVFCLPIYDQILVPITRKFSGKEKGLSELQRIGIGFFMSILALVAAALVEIRRLQLAKEPNSVNENVEVSLHMLWQIPQFLLMGVAEVFTVVGLIEFFYDQSPDAMRSFCSALNLLDLSMGSYLNSLILMIVTAITTAGGKPGWIPDDLNDGHLDYFFFLLAGLISLTLFLYVYYAMMYKEKKYAS